MNPKTRTVLQILVSVFLFALLFYFVPLQEVLVIASQINPVLFPIIVLVFFLGLLVGGYSLKLLIDPILEHPKPSFWKIFEFNCIGSFSGFFAPSKIGEFSFVYLLKREGIPLGKATAIFLLNRSIGLAWLGIAAVFSLRFFFKGEQTVLPTIVLLAAALVFGWLFFTEHGRSFLKKWILGKHQSLFEGFWQTNQELWKKGKKAVILNVLLTAIRLFALQTLLVFLIFSAVGADVDPFIVLLLNSASSILGLLPIGVQGLGIREGGFVFLASLAGINSQLATATVLVETILSYVILAIITSVSLFQSSQKKRLQTAQ